MAEQQNKSMKLKNILLIAMAVILTIAATQNLQQVNITFLFWDFSCSLVLLVIVVLLAGIFIGYVLSMARNRKSSKVVSGDEPKKKGFLKGKGSN